MMRRWQHPAAPVAALLILAGLGIVAHAAVYGFFVTDDAFISLRYTQRLLAGEGLTWTDYDRVEGYSNLLWVLLCAVPGALGMELVASARLLGWLATLATFVALLHVSSRGGDRRLGAAAWGIAIVAVSSPFGVWSLGGLETPLFCALLVWGVVGAMRVADARRWLVVAAMCLGLLCWTRPDGALFAVAVGVALALGGSWRSGVVVAGVAVGCVVAQLLFRLGYYGDYLPNPAYAKVAVTWVRVEQGLRYLGRSLAPLAATWVSLVMLGVLAVKRRTSRPAAVVVLAPAVGWTLYLGFVGGDIFPAWRQLMPVVALGGVAAIRVIEVAAEQRTGFGWDRGGGLLLLAVVGAHLDPGNWAARERWQWDGRPVGRFLAMRFGDRQPLVAVDAAGALPFYSQLPALDLLGLCDRYLAHHRPASMGRGGIGHELGDADYFLERAPDVFCFGVPPCAFAAQTAAERDLVQRSEFGRRYAPLRFAIRDEERLLVSELWVRRDGALGVQASPALVRVPAYFFAAVGGARAEFLDDSFEVRPDPSVRQVRVQVSLPSGAWSACLPDSKCAGCSVEIQQAVEGRSPRRLHADSFGECARFSLSQDARVGLRVSLPQGTAARFGDLELRRQP